MLTIKQITENTDAVVRGLEKKHFKNAKETIEQVLAAHKFFAIGEQNPKIKQIKGVLSNTKPNPNKLFVAEGIWLLSLCEKFHTPIESLILCPEYIHTSQAASLADSLALRAGTRFTVSAKTYDKISERGQPDGLMALAQLPTHDLASFHPADDAVLLVLDGVEIPGNIGTMLRMADGAGVDLSVPLFEFESVASCRSWLDQNGFTVYLADTRADLFYYDEPFGKKTALVMGSERYGISREWYDTACQMIAIPMEGSCDSLNVGVAATVLAYEAVKKNKFLPNHIRPHP